MEIKLNNVCSIKEGRITLNENKVNIKYGNNGIGKSSITKAIIHTIQNESLDDLHTYGCGHSPVVVMDPSFHNALSFNEDYLKNYLFKEDIVNK